MMKTEDPEIKEPVKDIGSQLLAARKKNGRELGDLSTELHISVSHLRALEGNHFEGLGGPTFVKSYIRSYARAVDLAPEPLIRIYLATIEPEHHWDVNRQMPPQRDYRLLLTIGTVIVSAILASLFVIWLVGNQNQASLSPDLPDSSAASEAKTQWVPEISSRQAESAEVSVAGGGQTTDDLASAIVDSSEATKAVDDVNKTPVSSEEETTTASLEGPSVETVSKKRAESGAGKKADADVKASDQPMSSGAGADRVQIDLKADSWVEVYDAARTKLLHGLYKAGVVKTVKGQAPFQVFLGNAPGAKIKFNETDFDMTSYIRPTNTARFALVSPQ